MDKAAAIRSKSRRNMGTSLGGGTVYLKSLQFMGRK
jgi:hypothetical protein